MKMNKKGLELWGFTVSILYTVIILVVVLIILGTLLFPELKRIIFIFDR